MGTSKKYDPPSENLPGNRPRPAARRLDLINGPVFSTTLKLAIPVIGSHLLNLALGIADMIMVGALGKEQLAGLVISNSLLGLLFAIGWGTGFAVITFVSQRTGAEKHDLARRSAAHALMFATALGFIMVIVGNFFLPSLIAVCPSLHRPDLRLHALLFPHLHGRRGYAGTR